jgi:Leucine-rich repeat (LRR) protein
VADAACKPTAIYSLDNQISKIEGLKHCYRLQHLSLAHNRISRIEELEGLPLKYLSLVCDQRTVAFLSWQKVCLLSQRSNQIRKIEKLDTLQYLQQLNLSCNQLNSLDGFPERLGFLEVLDLADNQVGDFRWPNGSDGMDFVL